MGNVPNHHQAVAALPELNHTLIPFSFVGDGQAVRHIREGWRGWTTSRRFQAMQA
jgi:hypothetical protein